MNQNISNSNQNTYDNDDTPNLDAYCEETERDFYATQLGHDERRDLELAFAILESTFIELHHFSDARAKTLLITLGTISDNARDLARDEG